MEPAAERELIRLCLSGEPEALEPIVRAYEGRIYGFLLGLTRDADDARDLVQETFIRAWQRLAQYQPDRPLLPWLLAIARSRFRDDRRRRRTPVRLDAAKKNGYPEPVDPSPHADRMRMGNQRKQQVWSALGRLDRTDREVLVLKDISGLGYAEIAGILGIPLGTVASRVHYARRALREELQAEGEASLVSEYAGTLH
jgi:RNA polymerase sigma-70 factor (ECF subfamily)